ncbi:TonB family protein [uncultured Selenomonas sp.]|uniref:energy transducer TonB n=1 Tax=uncultured Selenomonas sp. TaxID=159275 RepID=UPI0028F080D9|nr:TonB family protein [uncultured Selenomonas sp.]
MDVTVKEKYLSWGASFGIHFCIIAVAAAMGLFSMAAEPEKRPIDVVIYDASAPESAPEPAAEAAPPMPSIDDIPLEPPKKEQTEQQQEPPKDMPKTNATNTSAAPTSQGTGEKPSAAPSANTGTGSGEGTGRDAAAAQRPRTPPKLISGAAPVYPKELERKGITGSVGLAIVVGANGSVQSVDVTSSSGHAELDQAAITAAYTYYFEPARNIYDEPVACRVNRSFSFS